MSEPLLKLGSIVILGIGCEWFAERIGIPSILVLLFAGFFAGPVTGFLNPDQLLGDFLFPIVSLSVAIILFEGGLRLRLRNFNKVRGAIMSLTTIGVFLTASMSAFLGWSVLQFQPDVAILFGTILVITGPTVIIPLLRNLKLDRRIRTVSIWEGIANDPLGSILSVMVYELIIVHNPPGIILMDGVRTLATTVAGGVALAVAGAILLGECLDREWIPSHLRNPVTLASVLSVFLVAELFHAESGLIATPLMGIILTNRTDQKTRDILRFKKEIGIVLLSVLFILLSARFDLHGFQQISLQSFVVLGLLILVVRPIAVVVATLPTNLNWREITALSFFAPRGIVAATISSLFALKLVKLGYPNAGRLDAEVFFIIAGTVIVYGFLVPPFFRYLGLTRHSKINGSSGT